MKVKLLILPIICWPLTSCSSNQIVINDTFKIDEYVYDEKPADGERHNAVVGLIDIFNISLSSFSENDLAAFNIQHFYRNNSAPVFVDIDFTYYFDNSKMIIHVDEEFNFETDVVLEKRYFISATIRNKFYRIKVVESESDYIIYEKH